MVYLLVDVVIVDLKLGVCDYVYTAVCQLSCIRGFKLWCIFIGTLIYVGLCVYIGGMDIALVFLLDRG